MAVTLSVAELARAVRAGTTDAETAELTRLLAVGSDVVIQFAPDAPEAILNEAVVRVCGWLYDAPTTGVRMANPLRNSGAAALLQPHRDKGAGIIAGDSSGGQPVPSGSGLPPLPGSGSFILAVKDGALTWIEFPLPPVV